MPSDRKKGNKERKRRYDCRKRAKQAMKDLVDNLERIQEISRHPEREFARIFSDEDLYFGMIKICHSAYEKSYESNLKLFDPKNLKAIQFECWAAGLFPSAKQLSDRHFRETILRKLAAREVEPGYSYLQRLRNRILDQSLKDQMLPLQKARREHVACPKCGLEQAPVENYVMCQKCGFQGAIIGNLYIGP